MIGLIITAVVLVFLVLWVIGIYNRLVALRVGTQSGWAQIDVQLKRRYDLIPNLVETVKGYAAHEKTTLENVVKARQTAIDAKGVVDQAAAENMLSGALRQLFALSEAYPDLKANTNFLQLQGELGTTENMIGSSRQDYNGSVREYNTAVQQFPGNIIAGMFGFQPAEFFEVEEKEMRIAPKVQF